MIIALIGIISEGNIFVSSEVIHVGDPCGGDPMVIMWVNIWMDDVLTPRRPNMCAASILFLGKYHFVVLPLSCVWTCYICPSPLIYTFTFIMKALMTYFPREIHEIFFQSILNSDTRQTKLKQRKVSAIRIALDNKWKPVFH